MKKILSIMLCAALLLAVAALAIGCTDKDKETDPTEPVSTEQNGDNTESGDADVDTTENSDATESDAQETESGDVDTTEASETDAAVVVGEGDEVGVIGDD